MKKYQKIILVLVTAVFLFAFKTKAFAAIPIPGPGDPNDCVIKSDCVTKYGGVESDWACQSTMCLFLYKGSSYQKFEQSIDQCYTTGEMNMDCYYAGTEIIDPENGQTGAFPAAINSALSLLVGLGRTSNNQSLQVGIRSSGAIATVNNMVGFILTNPPASSVDYIAYELENLKLVKPAYAQQGGVAFNSLKAILPVWKTFRDVAYVFYVIIFVVVGLAIMLRVKLDPKTAITIQNAIPKFVISLILITFSYAIAGLMIDLIYVVSALGVAIINPTSVGYTEQIVDILNSIGVAGGRDNPNSLVFMFTYIGKGAEYAGVIARVFNPITLVGELFGASNPVINSLQMMTAFNFGAISSLVTLILSIVLFLAFFKIFFTLLKTYIMIILSIILAPLQIMFNAIPGQKSFGTWFRNLLSNLAVFPTVILLLALTSKIVSSTASAEGGFWMPPVIKLPINVVPARFITAIISYGMLLLIPKMADMVRDALKVPAFKYGSAIGEAMKPVTGTLKKGYGAAKDLTVGEGGIFEPQIKNIKSGIVSKIRGQAGLTRETEIPSSEAIARAGLPPGAPVAGQTSDGNTDADELA